MNDKIRKAIHEYLDENGGMDAAIADLSEYNTKTEVVNFRDLSVHTPSMLRLLAGFADDLSREMGEELSVSFSGISRQKNRQELEDAAIDRTYWNDRDRWQAIADD